MSGVADDARAERDAATAAADRSNGLPFEIRYALLRQHGSFIQAYSVTVQPDLLRFGDHYGFIAYKRVWGTAMVLADPVAPPRLVDDLVDHFLRENPDAAFWQISRPLASMLARRGFLVNELGVETRLDLDSYNFEGQKKRNLRKATHRMAKLGYTIRECPLTAIVIDDAKALSDAWRRTRTFRNREISFLNRPISFDDEPDMRRLFAFDHDGRMMAFCFCDPIYQSGEVVGYSTSNVRHHPGVDLMIGHALKRHAAELFQSEGRKWLSLGLSPAEGIEDKDFERDWLVRRGLRFAYTSTLFNRFIYPLQGHAAHKRQFHGTTEQTYMAISRRPSLPRVLKLFRACNMI